MVTDAIGLSVGSWLTCVTLTLNVCVTLLTPLLAVPPLSITVTVITAEPLALGAGTIDSVAPSIAGWCS